MPVHQTNNFTLIKNFDDRALYVGQGKWDEWCIYLLRHTANELSASLESAVKDADYFAVLGKMSDAYGTEEIYTDFSEIYRFSKYKWEQYQLDLITKIASNYTTTYTDDSKTMDVLFTILYLGMIAENNKKNKQGQPVKLKKRIKALGVHMLLLEEINPFTNEKYPTLWPEKASVVANSLRGVQCSVLEDMCSKRDIFLEL